MDKHSFLIQGPITPDLIASCYVRLAHKTDAGAHNSFAGQVRADKMDGHAVTAIDYSVYEPMAHSVFSQIREAALQQFGLQEVIILHSIGKVKAGEIGLFVLVASKHRKPTFDAIRFVVEEIKAKVPVFGKEILSNHHFVWKKNRT